MNAAQLKASILQQAIEGKLVPQLAEEGIVEQIGDAPTEVPFEIPASWKWYTLGNLIEYGNCKQVAGKDITSSTWVLDLEDIEKNTGKIIEKKRNVKSTSNKNVFEEGYVLYSKLRPYLNKVVIADETGVCTTEIIPINVKTAKVPLLPHYLQFCLMSPYFLNYANRCSYGVKMPRLGTNDAKAAYIPLPPLAEQKRIVAKIEELMPLVEEYGKAYDKLQELNDELPGKLKASILQEAIQGNLVPQLPEDGVVEQIGDAPSEVPFDIPDSWKWLTLEAIGFWKAGATPLRSVKEYYENGTIPWLKTGDLTDGIISTVEEQITQDALDSCTAHINPKGSVLIAMYGATIGKLGVLDIDCATNQACCACQVNSSLIYNWYLFYYLMSQRANFIAQGVGGAQPNISKAKIIVYPIPLPPLDEQKRIVAKIEALFEQIDLMTK